MTWLCEEICNAAVGANTAAHGAVCGLAGTSLQSTARLILPAPCIVLGVSSVDRLTCLAAAGRKQEQLKKSGLGHVIMFLSKLPDELPANRRMAKELVQRWSRPIFEQYRNDRCARTAPTKSPNSARRMDDFAEDGAMFASQLRAASDMVHSVATVASAGGEYFCTAALLASSVPGLKLGHTCLHDGQGFPEEAFGLITFCGESPERLRRLAFQAGFSTSRRGQEEAQREADDMRSQQIRQSRQQRREEDDPGRPLRPTDKGFRCAVAADMHAWHMSRMPQTVARE